MKFNWNELTKTIRVIFTDGDVLEFQANLWNRTGLDKDVFDPQLDATISTDIFSTYNMWWETQSLEKEMVAKRLYTSIVDVFDQQLSANETNKQLYTYVEDIILLHDWKSFREFFVDTVKLNFEVYKKEKLEANDTSIDTTYFTEASVDLVVFSIMVKSLMPVWGLYYYNYKIKLGSEFAMLYSVYLVRTEALTSNPAWVKLHLLVHTVADKKIKANLGYSITNDIGSEEQPDLILTLVLLKKVCNFDPLIVGDSIIRNVYALLRDRCDRILRGGPRSRRTRNRDGEPLSVVDSFNIIKLQPLSVEVAVRHWIQNIKELLVVSEYAPEIDSLALSLSDLEETQMHYQILTMVVGPILGGRNLLLQRKDKICELLAAVSVWLEINGYQTVSELLIARPNEKNMNVISFSSITQKPIPSGMQAELAHIYKHVLPRTPHEELIAGIIKQTNSYDYHFANGNITDLQCELAALLIHHNTEMKKLKESVYA